MELTVNGQSVYCYTGTKNIEPGRKTIVFVHGAALDHSVWILQSRYFAYHDCNVLAVDLPGHGRSQGAPLASIENIADWLIALLDSAGIDRAALVGHSMGALVALHAAGHHADRVNALALLGIACPMRVSDELLTAAKADSALAIDMITVWGHSAGSHFGGNPAPGLWMVGGGKRLLEKAPEGVLYNDLSACNNYRDGMQAAARIDCPALFVLGQRDMMTPPRAARDIIASIKDAQTIQLKGCGHMMFYERPGDTLDALSGFFSSQLTAFNQQHG